MGSINTIHGLVDEALLVRSVRFEDKPREFVVVEEWRLADELVRNNVWVHLKEASVVAEGIAGGF